MKRGCKCLELDCWDGENGEPIVYHGFTLTSKIPFQGIITAVKHYIDANPDTLPIILSLENHCSHPFQEKMASILNGTLGGRIYHFPEGMDELPAPIDLVGKVVVKGKRPPEKDDGINSSMHSVGTTAHSVEEEEKGDCDNGEGVEMSETSRSFRSGSDHNNSPQSGRRISVMGKLGRMSSTSSHSEKVHVPKVVPELARITLLNGAKYKDFPSSIALPLGDMHSFSEPKVDKVLKDPNNVRMWKEYNERHMSRIYPAGVRVDSSNYNPVPTWSTGCQLVALNYQTNDSNMTLNDGRFQANGGCGYVLRPRSTFPGESGAAREITLKIKVLSGSCLPKPSGESVGEGEHPILHTLTFHVSPLQPHSIIIARLNVSMQSLILTWWFA